MSNKTKQGTKRPHRLTIGIYLDDEVADRADVAEKAYEKVRLELERTRPRRLAEYAASGLEPHDALERVQDEDADGLGQLSVELAEAHEALDEATEWFVFEALGHRRLTALIRQHPATEEQKAQATAEGREVGWNPDTFLRALVEDSCIAPAGYDWDDVFGASTDLEDAAAAEDDDPFALPARSAWSASDVEALCATALAANQTLRTADTARRPPIGRLVAGG